MRDELGRKEGRADYQRQRIAQWERQNGERLGVRRERGNGRDVRVGLCLCRWTAAKVGLMQLTLVRRCKRGTEWIRLTVSCQDLVKEIKLSLFGAGQEGQAG